MRAMTPHAARRTRPFLIAAAIVFAVLAIAGAATWLTMRPDSAGGGVQIGGPFTLTDQDGATVTDRTYDGQYRLIYFGYTFCPDACPTELQIMAQARDALGPAGDKVQPIFVTIDPDRDTAAQLKGYVTLFDKKLVGLTGAPDQIARIAKEYKVYYARADQSAAYAMNHSSFVYLMDPDGRFLTVFSSDVDADAMAAGIKRYMNG
jgi:protein SCO1/2